jgi:hypothetical protein
MSDQLGSAAAHQQPTPYADVNAEVHDLLPSLHAILGQQLTGMYLVGSLALGDFDPQDSDLFTTPGARAEAAVALACLSPPPSPVLWPPDRHALCNAGPGI